MGDTVLAHGALGGHGGHVVMLVVPVVIMMGLALGADFRRWQYRNGRSSRPTLSAPAVAAALSIVAGGIHAVAGPAHFSEATVFGLFFALSAGAQLGWAGLVLVRRSRSLLWLGIVGNFAVVALWAVTRTVGLPFGPGAGQAEAVGALDVICSLAEVGVVVVCALALRRRSNPEAERYVRPSLRTNPLGLPSR